MNKKIKIIDFHPAHMDLMELREHEIDNVCYGNYKEKFSTLSKLGVSGTVMYDGKILCVIGVFDMWGGVCEVWILPSKSIDKHKLVFARLVKQQLEALWEVGKYHRIQVTAITLVATKRPPLPEHFSKGSKSFFLSHLGCGVLVVQAERHDLSPEKTSQITCRVVPSDIAIADQ